MRWVGAVARRIAGSSTRSVIATGPGAGPPPRNWVRTNGPSIKTNSPDGWMADNGPVWWLGSDNAWGGAIGPHGPDWQGYGYIPPYRGGPIGRAGEWGGTYAMPEQVMNGQGVLAAVTRATNIIIGPPIRTTWRYYRNTDPAASLADMRRGNVEVPRPLWVADPQLVGNIPGGEMGRPTIPRGRRLGAHDFWRTLLCHALWWGHGALLFTTDTNGQPLAGTLRIVHPGMWGWTEDGRLALGTDTDDPVEFDEDGTAQVGTVTWHMALLRGFAPHDGLTPGGALTRSGLLLSTATQFNTYLNNVLQTGVPAGVLKVTTPNFDQTDADTLKSRWMDAHGGARKSVAVLNAGIDFTPLQLNVVDADIVANKGQILVDIAHAFGLSAAWLDASLGSGGGNITYANISDRRRDLLDHTLADHGRNLEDLVSSLLPWGTQMSIDWAAYLNTDPSRDLAAVEQGLRMGYMTKAEARERLAMPVIDESELPDTTEAAPAPVPEPTQEGETNGQQENADTNP